MDEISRTERLIGDVYLKQEQSVCWIGYAISPVYARKGYMYEVISAMISFLSGKGTDCVKASVHSGN